MSAVVLAPTQIAPVAEMSLAQSVLREPLPLLNVCRFGGGLVLLQHLGQFGVGVNNIITLLGPSRLILFISLCVRYVARPGL